MAKKEKTYYIKIRNIVAKRSLFPYEQIKNQSKSFDSFSGAPEGQWPKKKKPTISRLKIYSHSE